MGKKKPTLAKPPQRMTRRERSRWQRESRIQRTFIIVFAAIGVITVAAISIGLYFDLVAIPNQVILRVNGEAIVEKEYWAARRTGILTDWRQTELQFQIQQWQGITLTKEQQQQYVLEVSSILGQLSAVRRGPHHQATIQSLIEEKALLQGARALGIAPSMEEVEAWLLPDQQAGEESGLWATPTQVVTGSAAPTVTALPSPMPTPVATLTPQQRRDQLVQGWAAQYENLRSLMAYLGLGSPGFSSGEYVEMVRHSSLVAYVREKAKEKMAAGLPKEEEQVRASRIVINERSLRAQEAWKALKAAPASFARLAVQYSDDAVRSDAMGSRDRAGDLGWLTPAGPFYTDVVTAALRLREPGEVSPVITGTSGYHILQLVERRAAGEAHVRHIFIPFDRRPQAEAAFSLLEKGQTFDQVARTYSEDETTAQQGGSLGAVVTASLSPEVRAAVLLLTTTNPLSSVTPIVEDAQGFHILKLVQGNPAGGTVRLQEILIRTARARADQARAALGARASFYEFSQAVVKYSAYTPTVELAGDIGTVTAGGGQLPESVFQAAQSLTATQSMTMTRDAAGNYYLLQLVERGPAGLSLHLRLILVQEASSLAGQIRDYILNGGPAEALGGRFAEMAARFSDDTATRNNGGDMDWFSRRKYPEQPELLRQAFDVLGAGQVSEVFAEQGASAYQILWVQERDPHHPLDQATLDQDAQDKFDRWLADLVATATLDPQPTPTPGPPTRPPTFTPEVAAPTPAP